MKGEIQNAKKEETVPGGKDGVVYAPIPKKAACPRESACVARKRLSPSARNGVDPCQDHQMWK